VQSKSTKTRHHIPDWIFQVPERVLPSGPKMLYQYLCFFDRKGNWEYNYRLAKRFGVTERAIRKWIHWLKFEGLITVVQPFNRRRRLWPVLHGSRIDWFKSQCLAEAQKKLKKAYMGQEMTRAERDRQLLLLLGSKAAVRKIKREPFLFKDSLPNLTFDDLIPPSSKG